MKSNRYGDLYEFQKVDENIYTIVGGLKHWRYGGRQGQQEIYPKNLGFVDPSGGPFIEVGMQIEGRIIKNISVSGDYDNSPHILFEVQ